MPSKILIVDGMAQRRAALHHKLAAAYFEALPARDGCEAISLINRENPDAIIVYADLPDMSGEAFCMQMKAINTQGERPVLMILPENRRSALMSGLASGADQVFAGPVGDTLLFAQLRNLIRGRGYGEDMFLQESDKGALGFGEPTAPFLPALRIAIVSEDRPLALRWRDELQLRSQHRFSGYTPRELMNEFDTQGIPDILMIGIDDQEAESGLSLLATLGTQSKQNRTVFLAVIKQGDHALAAEALNRGADDLLLDGFASKEALLRLNRLARRKQLADSLHRTVKNGLRAALIDPLTGIYNRRYAFPKLQKMAETARQGGNPLAVMLADIDHFKQINDQHGHIVGDEVLRSVTERLSSQMPTGALLARIGGEEFLIAIPDMPVSEARMTARRLCDSIGDVPVDLPGMTTPVPVTISIGLSLGGGQNAQETSTATQLVKQADQALYSAKSEGRNQVTVSRPAA